MITDEELKRINELARKAKRQPLTKEEKEEQHELRQKYLQNIRASFKNQLKSVKVIDPTGEDVTPQKLKDLKKNERS
ncbi:MAG TPA: DUF896 domain-containing protein [Bacillota bacterium]|nr:DUF896 domain-containing protein [Bacillota bacterium]